MGFFTSHADAGLAKSLGWHDEQDIEMLSASLLKDQFKPYYQPAGIQMTNYNPLWALLKAGFGDPLTLTIFVIPI